jgi:hypothetical protein
LKKLLQNPEQAESIFIACDIITGLHLQINNDIHYIIENQFFPSWFIRLQLFSLNYCYTHGFPQTQNPECSKIQNFYSHNMVSQMGNSTYEFMWQVAVTTQLCYIYCVKVVLGGMYIRCIWNITEICI